MKRTAVYSALSVISVVSVLSSCAVPGGGKLKKEDGSQAVREELTQVKSAVSEASAMGGEWRDTGKIIKQAEAALGRGELSKAKRLLSRAKAQAELGYLQAQSQIDLVSELSDVAGPVPESVLKEGKQISFDRKKGNCLSCHAMDDGVSPGTIGPPLVAIKDRFPNKGALYGQIWDATVRNPQTLMPPFGRYQILSKAEIEKIVEYIWTL